MCTNCITNPKNRTKKDVIIAIEYMQAMAKREGVELLGVIVGLHDFTLLDAETLVTSYGKIIVRKQVNE